MRSYQTGKAQLRSWRERAAALSAIHLPGLYEDPEHPGCKREVRVDGMKAWPAMRMEAHVRSRLLLS